MFPGHRLVMRTAQGPFPMETTYRWQDTAQPGTRMTLLNRGGPTGLRALAAPLLARAMGRANREDLKRLKELLEAARLSVD